MLSNGYSRWGQWGKLFVLSIFAVRFIWGSPAVLDVVVVAVVAVMMMVIGVVVAVVAVTVMDVRRWPCWLLNHNYGLVTLACASCTNKTLYWKEK